MHNDSDCIKCAVHRTSIIRGTHGRESLVKSRTYGPHVNHERNESVYLPINCRRVRISGVSAALHVLTVILQKRMSNKVEKPMREDKQEERVRTLRWRFGGTR